MRFLFLPSRLALRPAIGATVAGAVLAAGLVLAVGPVAGQMRTAPAPTAPSAGDGRRQASEGAFRRLATVLQHPRCLNCHTNTDFPRQGDDRRRHTMNVRRGPDDRGAPGMLCSNCHQRANQVASGVPGADEPTGWRLAPLRMGWEGLSVGALCRALLDPARGGMKPEQFEEHHHTHLVEWAWAPGRNARGEERAPPPLTHADFIEETRRWVGNGAACPAD